jgi:hypothetical protein
VKKARQMTKDAKDHSSSVLSQMNKRATEFVDETTQKITQQEIKYHNSMKLNHEKALEQERLNFQKRKKETLQKSLLEAFHRLKGPNDYHNLLLK